MALAQLRAAARPLKPLLKPAMDWWDFQKLPQSARAARERDLAGVTRKAAAPELAIRASLDWLVAAQTNSGTRDGGVARDYSHTTGWAASYPETTGYIIPTLIDQGNRLNDPRLIDSAREMLDWLVSIQFPEGGFQGGTIGQTPRVPVTFNTGQILMGLAAGAREFGEPYRGSMRRAAEWLATTQDDDGCWRKHPTPFATHDDKAYETHVSWGLLEAARVDQNADWFAAAYRQVDWAISCQEPNGWLRHCCLSRPDAPLTHTLGYALRGIMEAWQHSGEKRYLDSARLLANGLMNCLGEDGYLCGRLNSEWQDSADWVCLTGTAQIAHSWLMLSQVEPHSTYFDAANRALDYVRRRIDVEGPETTRGAVAGSFPIHGDYVPYGFPNWAAKFFIDAQQLQLDLAGQP